MSTFAGAQLELIKSVARKFAETEDPLSWDELDERLYLVEKLNDDELYVETDKILNKHLKGAISFKHRDKAGDEFLEILIRCIAIILGGMEENFSLTHEARYVMRQYLAHESLGNIVHRSY